MTPHAFLAIFSGRRKLLLTILGGTLLLSIAFYRLQVETYSVALLLSVTRSAVPATTEYQYDQFYRLQADERFADTLVRYLESEQAVLEIVSRTALAPSESAYFLERQHLVALRLSSQLILVKFQTKTRKSGEALAEGVLSALNRYTMELNRPAQDPHWFLVQKSDPTIEDVRFTWQRLLFFGFLIGVFVAFWTALLDHFFSKPAAHENRH